MAKATFIFELEYDNEDSEFLLGNSKIGTLGAINNAVIDTMTACVQPSTLEKFRVVGGSIPLSIEVEHASD